MIKSLFSSEDSVDRSRLSISQGVRPFKICIKAGCLHLDSAPLGSLSHLIDNNPKVLFQVMPN